MTLKIDELKVSVFECVVEIVAKFIVKFFGRYFVHILRDSLHDFLAKELVLKALPRGFG